jgi:serine protease Do
MGWEEGWEAGLSEVNNQGPPVGKQDGPGPDILRCESETIQDESETIQGESETIQDESETIIDESETILDETDSIKSESETIQGESKSIAEAHGYAAVTEPVQLWSNNTSPGRRQKIGRRSRIWKQMAAAALVLALITGSVAGVSFFNRLNDELGRQSVLVGSLSQQLADQKLALSQSETALGLARDLSSRVDALNRANLSGSTAPDADMTKAVLAQGSTVTDIARQVGPSVVGIRMTMTMNSRRYQANQATSEGSGIIISADGYIMTNYHVVSYADPKAGNSKATTLEVFLPDGRSEKAKFVGGDSENDLAVVKIDLTKLSVAALGNSKELQVGELAVAIGNPLGMEFAGSVTVGVVSALNRKVAGQEGSLNLIQTDAAINPGNSGGALVNSRGQVIGINSAKISQTGVEGLGFAIAIDDARPIVQSLILYGYVKNRPYLGITGQDITDVMATMYNVPVGVYVTEIDPASGAAKAGVRTGDIITEVAGKPVTTMAELNLVKKAYKAGDTVTFTLMRDTQKLTVKVVFSEAK